MASEVGASEVGSSEEAVVVRPDAPPLPPIRNPRLRQWLVQLWPVSGATSSIAALDGVRGIAVLLTVAFHLPQSLLHNPNFKPDAATAGALTASQGWWSFGTTGVELFFVLSGFLLFMPYVRAMHGQPFPATGKFYLRRLLRIVPAYWASLVLILIVFEPQYLQPQYWLSVIIPHFLFVQDWTWDTYNYINSPYWTMAVESHYYLLLPLLAGAMVWLARRWGGLAAGGVLLLMVTAGFGFDALARLGRHGQGWLLPHISLLQVFVYLSVFAAGMACSWLYVSLGTRAPERPQSITYLAKLAGIGGIALILGYGLASAWATTNQVDILWQGDFNWTFVPVTLEGKFFWSLHELVLGLGYGGIVLGVLLGWPLWRRAMSAPWLRFVGIISYSLYIWNYVIYLYVIVPLIGGLGNLPALLLAGYLLTLLITFPIAFLSYHLIERRFIGLRRATH